MSLLIEALKKAEEAKRAAAEWQPPPVPGAGLSLQDDLPVAEEPVAQAPTNASGLPDLSQHIDSVDADLAAVSSEAPAKRRIHSPRPAAKPTMPTPKGESEREAVRNVFSAKRVPDRQPGLWVLIGLLVALAVIVGGAYFWWQINSLPGGSLATTHPASEPGQHPVATNPITTAAVPGQSPSAAASTTATREATRAIPAEATTLPKPEDKPLIAAPAAKANELVARQPSPVAERVVPDNPIRLTRELPRTAAVLERAYDALQAGHLDLAKRAYEQVLRSDAKSTDALLGLATIAARQNDDEAAQAYYLRALESDPTDATAQAGLVQMHGQTDPAQSESRLKTALANQPDAPALLVALGNLYAREQRWSEAQQAFFRAYSTDPDNPDFLFNLAVSLDHLHQTKLAIQYYQMSLAAADRSPNRAIAFERHQVTNRISELQP